MISPSSIKINTALSPRDSKGHQNNEPVSPVSNQDKNYGAQFGKNLRSNQSSHRYNQSKSPHKPDIPVIKKRKKSSLEVMYQTGDIKGTSKATSGIRFSNTILQDSIEGTDRSIGSIQQARKDERIGSNNRLPIIQSFYKNA